jgi:hypothetical protein
MSMGGAEATAPPIFYREAFAKMRVSSRKKSCMIGSEVTNRDGDFL